MAGATATPVTPSDFGKTTLPPTPESVVLKANPPTRTPDWDKLGEEISARYPQVLAELPK